MSNTLPAHRSHDILLSTTIMQSIVDGVIVADAAGRVCLINPAAAQLLNIDASAILGTHMADLPGIDGPPGSDSATRTIVVEGRTLRVHCTCLNASEEGGWLGRVVVYQDMRCDPAARQELIATLVHDLRTCLAALRASIDIILLGSIDSFTDQQRELLSIAKSGSIGALALLNQLRDAYHSEADTA